jgi:hypothetical protein
VEFLRRTDTTASRELRRLLSEQPQTVAICAPVLMELRLTGDDLARRKIERTLSGLPTITFDADADFELAADIYRAVRRAGHTVRSMIDCLIAAIALRSGAELVHRDVDIERIAAVLPGLRSRSLREAAPGS